MNVATTCQNRGNPCFFVIARLNAVKSCQSTLSTSLAEEARRWVILSLRALLATRDNLWRNLKSGLPRIYFVNSRNDDNTTTMTAIFVGLKFRKKPKYLKSFCHTEALKKPKYPNSFCHIEQSV